MAYTSKAVATEQYNSLTPVELRGLQYDWLQNNKDRSFLVNFFKVDPNKELKWWNELVVTIETSLELMTINPSPVKMTRPEYDVTGFKNEEPLTTFKFVNDFNGARDWAEQYFKDLTGYETVTFKNMEESELTDWFRAMSCSNHNQGIRVEILRRDVEI